MIKIKKIPTVLCLIFSLGVSFYAMAQNAPLNNTNPYAIREALVDKTVNIQQDALALGWYTGVVDFFEFRDILDRYLPLSNYLSIRLSTPVVLMTEKSDVSITKDAAVGTIDIVYTSAVEGVSLIKAGWQPVVGRTADIEGVIVMRQDIPDPEKLEGKKILAADGATVTYYAKYGLIKEGKINKLQFVEQDINQSQLLNVLRTKQVDGVVLRNTGAANLIKQDPKLYKVVYIAPHAFGHIIFVSPTAPVKAVENLRKAMLDLDPATPDYNKILRGLDGYQQSEKQPFMNRQGADFSNPKEVKELLGSVPKKIKFDN